jgi:hypothetical protein
MNAPTNLTNGYSKSERLLRLWLPVILSVLLGAAFVLWAVVIKLTPSTPDDAWTREFGHLFFLELGMGLIVGSVLALTIERYMRYQKQVEDRREEEKIRKNVFDALFGTAVSGELVTEMYKALFEPHFSREQLEIRFVFRELTAEEMSHTSEHDLIVLQQIVSFRARNLTDQVVNHTIFAREYLLIEHPDFKIPFKEFRMKGSDQTIHLKGTGLLEVVDRSTGAEESEMWHTMGPLTVSVDPKAVAEVCTVVEKVCRDTDTKTWITKHAAENLTLKVALANRQLYEALEFAVDQSHRQKLKKSDSSAVESAMSYEWTLDCPVLPCQGIILHWRRRRAHAASAKAA